MAHRPRWLTFAAVGLIAAFVFIGCTPAAAPTGTPTGTTSATRQPTTGATTAPGSPTGELMTYPTEDEVDCEAGMYNDLPYAGNLKQIKAVDASTVEFTMCAPDSAFLSKVAFSSLQINDSDYLVSTGGGGDDLTRNPNGTGPYKMTEFSDTQLVLDAFADYWGEQPKSPRTVFQWNADTTARLQALQSYTTVDGIDNVAPDSFATVEADAKLKLIPRAALNVTYLGFNHSFEPFDNEKVRQAIALGIDKQRIVDNFYGAGSTIGDFFTPCDIPGGCDGDAFPAFNPANKDAAQQLLADAGFPDGFETTLYFRAKPRSYINDPTAVVTDLQAQLKDNLNITVTLSPEEDASYLTNSSKGQYGLFLLGWGADYPDATNFLNYHFGTGANSAFGPKFTDLTDVLTQAAATTEPTARAEIYGQANTLLTEHVPMIPLAHGGSATAWLADVEGAHSSPLGNEAMFAMTPGDRDQLVWMQNGPPAGLYCGDETDGESLRACEQIGQSLYTYEIGGLVPEPSLATSCDPNEDLTVWTCHLREGVKFHKGATLDANDVVLSYAVQWDLANPLHIGRETQGTFDYFPGLFGDFLNVPLPAPAPSGSPAAASPGASPAESAPAESPAASPAESPEESPGGGASPSP